MPTLQVVQREADPYAKMVADAGQNIADTIIKRQAHELAVNQYKLDVKKADSEEAKSAAQSQMEFTKGLGDIAAQVRDGKITKEMGAIQLKQLMGATKKGFSDLAEHGKTVANYASMLQGPQPGEATESQARGGKLALDQEQSKLMKTATDQMGNQTGARADSVSGNGPANSMMLSGMSASGPQFINPAAKYAETAATQQATTDATNKPVQGLIQAYNQDLAQGFQEIGGQSNDAITAFAKGSAAKFTSQFSKDSIIPSLVQREKVLGQAIGAQLNRGRPTDKDQQIGEAVIQKITYPKATNSALQRSLDKIMSNPISGIPTSTLNDGAFGSKVGGTQVSPDAHAAIVQAKQIIDYDKARVAEMQSMGATPDQINATLDKLHQAKGW